jgi:hypothetical protein
MSQIISSGSFLKKNLKTLLQTILSNFVLLSEPGYALTCSDKAYMLKTRLDKRQANKSTYGNQANNHNIFLRPS